MSDLTGDERSDADRPDGAVESGAEVTRRPSPGAQAASRARRIGGRPMPGPRSPVADELAPARDKAAMPATPAKPAKPKSPKLPPRADKAPRPPGDPAVTQGRLLALATTLAVLSTVAILALLGVGLWLSHGVWWAKTPTDSKRMSERQQVLAAAKTCTARILSYDYRTLAASEKAGQDCSTGQLKTDYTRLMDTTVKQIAPQNNVVQVFQVAKAGVSRVSSDGKQWVVVVFGQQQVTSKSVTAGPRLDISNAVVTLNKVGNSWLISNMTTAS